MCGIRLVSFWDGPAYFQGQVAVGFREGYLFLSEISMFFLFVGIVSVNRRDKKKSFKVR